MCKFLPPRANFLAAMSPDEMLLMKRHGAFLNDLMGQGMVIAHGPVDDPDGGWGLSLYQVEDDVDVAAIASQDPDGAGGRGAHRGLPHAPAAHAWLIRRSFHFSQGYPSEQKLR
ncbi:MAG TPA: YciI family protein, partial [Burkholderiaceae bacterium]